MDFSFDMFMGPSNDPRHNQGKTETNSVQLADLRRELSDLQNRFRTLQMVNRAFLELIADRIGLDQAEVEARMQEIMQEATTTSACVKCKRPLPKSGKNCMYCGAAPPR